MKYDKDISALTIQNIATIESSLRVIADIEEVLFKAISRTVKQTVESSKLEVSEDQVYDFDVANENEDIHFGSKNWESKGELYARYYLDCGDERDGRLGYHWLCHALGEYDSSARLRFVFKIDRTHFNQYSGLSPQSYKKAFQSAFIAVFSNTKDFKLNLGGKGEVYIYHDFHLDKDTVASEYPDFDEASEAMKPVRQATQKIINAHSDFEAMVRQVMQEVSQ